MRKNPKLCDKNYNELFEEFKLLASQITPEWKIDDTSSDFGVTLAKIFCEMQEDTVSRLNRSINNIYLTFLNMIGVSLNPKIPAKGLVTIEASKNNVDSFIKKGSKITSRSGLVFETSEDINVSYNQIKSIFMASKFNEKIVKVFSFNEESYRFEKFKVFDFDSFENLQTNSIYLHDDRMFNAQNLDLNFKFKNSLFQKSEQEICDFFYLSKWQIYNENSQLWEDSSEKKKNDDFSIDIKFNNKADLYQIMGKNSRYVRVVPYKQQELKLTEILYCSNDKTIVPTEFLSGENEIDSKEFFPFKERYYIYDSFYIKCDEAFDKIGASIVLTSKISFVKMKIESQGYTRNYKLIMSDMDFAESEPSDVSIESIVWEYWKGNSWALLKTEEGNKFFAPSESVETRSTEFICPDDISETSVGSKSGMFIRARITKISNQFSTYVNYIVPFIKDFSINYYYKEQKRVKSLVINSNLQWHKISIPDNNKDLISVFNSNNEDLPSIYIRLDSPISSNILSIFFDIDEGSSKCMNSFKWQYWSREINNICSWKSLKVMDFTNNFSKSGIVKIFGSRSFVPLELFGENGYFIRIVDINDTKDYRDMSTINDIKFNTVKVIQKEFKPYEYFYMDGKEKNKICSLSSKNVFDLNVWVDEFSEISQEEQNRMEALDPGSIEIIKNKFGIVERVWVKWKETSNIASAKSKDRVYEINSESAQIRFGDGKCGKIPTEQYRESIRIDYSVTEGQKGNLDEDSMGEFDSVYPSVVGVYNSKPTYGGLDTESIEHAADRTFDEINRGNRIVSIGGFERAILFNNRNIFKVKCFPHINKYGKENFGSLTIIVLPKKIEKNYNKFWSIKEEIREFIKLNAPLNLSYSKNLDICEVQYIEFFVNVNIKIKRLDEYQDVYSEVISKIKNFLNPISGGLHGNGFDIGDIPMERDIINTINSISGINSVERMNVYTKVSDENGTKEILISEAGKLKFAVPIPKDINVEIDV